MTEYEEGLTGFVRQLAEKAAAAPDASEEQKLALALDVMVLCGTVAPDDEKLPGAVDDLIQIIRDYEKLTAWAADVKQLSAAETNGSLAVELTAHCAKLRDLGPFIRGGVVDLKTVLITAVDLGGHALKDPTLKEEIRKAAMEVPNKARQDLSAVRRKRARQMYHDEAKKVTEIAAELGISPSRVYEFLSG